MAMKTLTEWINRLVRLFAFGLRSAYWRLTESIEWLMVKKRNLNVGSHWLSWCQL